MSGLSYPIGQFEAPTIIELEQITQWIDEIAALPRLMESAVAGLSEAQLNTPYRPEGWTVRQVIHHMPDSHMGSYCRFHWALTEDSPVIKLMTKRPLQQWTTTKTSLLIFHWDF